MYGSRRHIQPNSPTQTMDLCGRIKKDTVEVATGATWTKHDLGPRPVQLREIRTEGILGDIRG